MGLGQAARTARFARVCSLRGGHGADVKRHAVVVQAVLVQAHERHVHAHVLGGALDVADVQARIVANYEAIGIASGGEAHLGIRDNYSFSEVTANQLREMCRAVARQKPDAIAIYCTNLAGAPLAAELEAELGIPIYDTIATVTWKALRQCGVDTRRIHGWGSLFQEL